MATNGTDRARREEVYDIQNKLYTISRHRNGKPYILPDGNMGDQTLRAIMRFQTDNGIEASGTLDTETRRLLNAIYEEVLYEQSRPQHIHFYDKGEIPNLRLGDSADEVFMIQLIFRALAREFLDYIEEEISGNFTSDTEQNVMEFQRVNDFEQLGVVDRKTWDRLSKYYNSFV